MINFIHFNIEGTATTRALSIFTPWVLSDPQVTVVIYNAAKPSHLAWLTQVAWAQPKCLSSLEKKRKPSSVVTTVDHHLEEGATCLYQTLPTQITDLAAISGAPISAHQDSRTRSSQVLKTSLLPTTRCLDSSGDRVSARDDPSMKQ